MRTILRSLALSVLFFMFAVPVSATAHCEFRLGFATLRDLIGHETVGECLENEHYNAIGDSNQQTTGGLMAWRKADNWTAFTDGYRTWINGPNGLVVRLNTERFDWEGEDPTPAPVPTPAPAPEPTPEPAPEPLVLTECPDEDTVRGWVSESLRLSGMGGDLLKKWMQQLSAQIDSFEWACAWFYYLGYGPENKLDFVNAYATNSAYRNTVWCTIYPHLSDLNRQEFHSFLRSHTTYFSPDNCQATARVQPTPTPRPTPTPTPQPTATPAPVQYIDPALSGTIRVLQSTEYGRVLYQALRKSNVVYVGYKDLSYLGDSIASFKITLDGDRINLDESMRNESVDARAAAVAHEIYHAWFWATGRHVRSVEGCYEEETQATRAHAKWWYERFGENGKRNPSKWEGNFNADVVRWLEGATENWIQSLEVYQAQCSREYYTRREGQ